MPSGSVVLTADWVGLWGGGPAGRVTPSGHGESELQCGSGFSDTGSRGGHLHHADGQILRFRLSLCFVSFSQGAGCETFTGDQCSHCLWN